MAFDAVCFFPFGAARPRKLRWSCAHAEGLHLVQVFYPSIPPAASEMYPHLPHTRLGALDVLAIAKAAWRHPEPPPEIERLLYSDPNGGGVPRAAEK